LKKKNIHLQAKREETTTGGGMTNQREGKGGKEHKETICFPSSIQTNPIRIRKRGGKHWGKKRKKSDPFSQKTEVPVREKKE